MSERFGIPQEKQGGYELSEEEKDMAKEATLRAAIENGLLPEDATPADLMENLRTVLPALAEKGIKNIRMDNGKMAEILTEGTPKDAEEKSMIDWLKRKAG